MEKNNANIRRLFVVLFCLLSYNSHSQGFSDSDTLNIYRSRQKILKYSLASTYVVGSASLYYIWYKDFDQEAFHFFDDRKEWEGVDKLGHMMSSYVQTDLLHKSFLWAGVDNKIALRNSALIAVAYQSTIEIMDGFSSEWGFSLYDFGSNILGSSLYLAQEILLGKQVVQMKMSYYPVNYPTDILTSEAGLFNFTLKERSNALFGSSLPHQFLKDYNGQTIWLSSSPSKWNDNNRWPDFLSLSFGFGANNMYGGFENRWEINDEIFILDGLLYPRYKQFILALDYDLESIKTDKPLLKSILKFLNIFKWPGPAIEYRSTGEWVFHLFYLN